MSDNEAHQPRYYTTMGRPVRIGCTCSWYPPNPPKRMSTSHTSFMAHRRRLGLPRVSDKALLEMRYADGPYQGMTWDEAYALDKGRQLMTGSVNSAQEGTNPC